MERHDWARIRAIFEEAVALNPEDRVSFLETSQIASTERQVIESMLEADATPPSMLDATQGSLSTLISDDTKSRLPEEIGPYSVVGVIGRGGMGLVVRARRTDLPKEVALKLVGDRWAGPQLLERFRREQSVLARLQHPNIAQLLDAGRSEDGTPYFAMEYVDGMPITEYADKEHFDVRARLDLFLEVCEAVQFAHRNLVIHRDLKPSNILVSREGRVKLLDFGISKLVDDDEQPLTITEFRALTPSYASPEQINGQVITTSSDVYSLGVVLYELLAGRRPYSLTGKSATAIARILNEETPPRPSEAVLSGQEVSSRQRSLSKALRGDLDNILLKALEKLPPQRYQSVEALASDVRRYIDGLPVEARAATVGYRLRKFVALHQWGVGMATGILLLLISFAVAVSYQQAQTATERDRAALEAAKSDRVVQFMLGLFEASDPAEALGDEVTARELLERGVERAESLSDQPLLQAETYQVVGRVYESLGRYEQAAELSDRALTIRRSLLGDDHPEVAESLQLLAKAKTGLVELDGALEAAREAVRIVNAQGTVIGPQVPRALMTLADVHRPGGQYDEADSLLTLSYDLLTQLHGPESEEAMQALERRGTLLNEAGRYPESEAVNRQVLAWQREHLPGLHPRTAQTLNDLGVSIKSQSRYEEAQPFYEEALDIQLAVYGEGHPVTASSLQNLAIFHGIQGHYEAAEPYFVRALASVEQAFGRSSPRTATILSAYAVLLGRTGRDEEAQARYREALSILLEWQGERHPQTLNTLYNLGVSLGKQGKTDESLPILLRVIELSRDVLGQEHHDLAERLGGIAVIESRSGDHDAAERHIREAVALDLAHRGGDHRRYAVRLGQLGRVLLVKGNYPEADSILTRALDLHVAATSDDHPETLTMRDALGQVKMRLGRYEEAHVLLSKAYTQRLERLGEDHPETKASVLHLEELNRLRGS